jgi:putative membrane protein
LPLTLAVMALLVGMAGLLRVLGGDPRGASGLSSLPPADRAFVMSAIQAGDAEVALAELAQTRSQDERTKTLAATIARDHAAATEELRTLARQKGVPIERPTEAQNAAFDRLEKLTGAAFDAAWAVQVVQDHRDAIALFTPATNAFDQDVRTYARSVLPALKTRLKSALDLHRTSDTPGN